jgi:hypothetical protein
MMHTTHGLTDGEFTLVTRDPARFLQIECHLQITRSTVVE